MAQLVSTGEAARLLGVSRRTLSRYAADGLLEPTVILPTGRYRWDLDDVRRQLAELRRRAQPEH